MRELRANVAEVRPGRWTLVLDADDPVTGISTHVAWALRGRVRDDAHLEALRLLRGWASLVEVAWKAPPDAHRLTAGTTCDIIGSSEREPKEDE